MANNFEGKLGIRWPNVFNSTNFTIKQETKLHIYKTCLFQKESLPALWVYQLIPNFTFKPGFPAQLFVWRPLDIQILAVGTNPWLPVPNVLHLSQRGKTEDKTRGSSTKPTRAGCVKPAKRGSNLRVFVLKIPHSCLKMPKNPRILLKSQNLLRRHTHANPSAAFVPSERFTAWLVPHQSYPLPFKRKHGEKNLQILRNFVL